MPSPPNASPATLHARLLGPPEFSLDGGALCGRTYGKLIGLLAFLLMEPRRPHPRAELAALFWPDHPRQAALRNLRLALHNLRQALGPLGGALLHIERATVSLVADGPVSVDAWELQKPPLPETPLNTLERRAALYRGAFLAGFALEECPGFEEWRDMRAESLRRAFLDLLAQLANGCEARGELERAQRYALRRVELEPWDEVAQRRLMELLARVGQPWAAVARFREFAALLRRELDADPEPATVDLFDRIRTGRLGSDNPAAAARTADGGERRPLTALCIRLADNEADPEILVERAVAAEKQLNASIPPLGGTLAASPDGTWIAYFGFPTGHEGAARRAAEVGLRLAGECAAESRRACFALGLHADYAVSDFGRGLADGGGNVTAGAAGLAYRAAAGELLASADCEPLIRGHFELAPAAPAQPAAYRVVRAIGHPKHLTNGPLTPFCGRREELRRLDERWAATPKHSQSVLIAGEAGIGKSRLVQAFGERLADTHDARVHIIHCQAEYHDTPYFPFIQLYESLAGYAANDSEAVKHRALERLLAPFGSAGETALPFLARLLGLPGGHAAERLAATQLKELTERALSTLLGGGAEHHPVLLIAEDVHWADPSTLELLHRLAQAAAPPRVLVLMTARPEPHLPAIRAHHRMELAPFGAEEVGAMVAFLAGTDAPALMARIQRLADGIPLYVEELTRMLLGGGDASSPVPKTLLELLHARIDALEAAKPIAQLCAVLGREFPLELFAAVARHSVSETVARLEPLVDAGILSAVKGSATTSQYRFRHALFQEAAYNSQLRAQRTQLHRRVADTLVERFARFAAQHPERVAHHYGAAGMPDAAVPWWLRAGRRSLRESANAEAVEQLRAGLSLLERVSGEPNRNANELDLLLPLGHALHSLQGFGSAEAASAYDRAYALSLPLQTDARRFEALWGRWIVSSSRTGSHFSVSARLAEELLQAARTDGSASRLAYAHSAIANVDLWQARFESACSHAQAAVTSCDEHEPPPLHGHDPRVASLGYLAWARYQQGRDDEAVAAGERAVTWARRLDHPESLCFALVHAGVVHRWRRDLPALTRIADEAGAVADQYHLAFWQAAATMLRGWVRAFHGEPEGVEWLAAAAQAGTQAMPGAAAAYLLPLAEGCAFVDDPRACLETAERALDIAARLHDRLHPCDLLRVKGEALFSLGERDAALVTLNEAAQASRRHAARPALARTLASLARCGEKKVDAP